jgi:PEP-CTERM motif
LNDPVVNHAASGKRVRRRRSWYRRRLRRRRRILIGVVFGTLFAAAAWQSVATYYSSASNQAASALPDPWLRGNSRRNLASLAVQPGRPIRRVARIPGVYPYSVIPGGVKSAEDLRYAALRDWVVRRHFARFDFSHARLERTTEAREVYLSYRILDAIYWTRKKVRLEAGELVLTDGKISAKVHCGNQISETPQPQVSEEEPSEDVLDQPVAVIEPSPSISIRPRLAAPDLPSGQPIPPQLFAHAFVFPYVQGGAVAISQSSHCPAGEVDVDGHCRKKIHKRPIVPEPSTTMLLGSGLALIAWRYRKIGRSAVD